MKNLLISFFLAGLCLSFFTSCCGDDGDFQNLVPFSLVEKQTGLIYYEFGGPLFGETLEIFQDDNSTPATFEHPQGGLIVVKLEDGYGQINGSTIERKYYLHLAESDIDTLSVFSTTSEDRCNGVTQTLSRCVFNDSTYTTRFDFLK